jgi:hypothetical protein
MSASSFIDWDRCRRKWTWQWRDRWHLQPVSPLGAVYSALHKAVTSASADYSGPHQVRQMVMDMAGERGVWTEQEKKYDLMVHHAYLAEVLARVLRQPSGEARQVHPRVGLGVGEWWPEAYLDPSGMRLLRFVLVDHWDDDRQLAECHSWRTIGDVCVTGMPMTLQVLVIGQSRSGRRYGHWTRARQHPLNKGIRFARKTGKGEGLAESWKTVWREEIGVKADSWVEQMARDGVLREAAFNVEVRVPEKWARERVLEDVKRIGAEIEELREKRKYGLPPMTRSACDDVIQGPCPFQSVCYAAMEIGPGETGLFRQRERD